jgi:signal recognition particle subunit SRP54
MDAIIGSMTKKERAKPALMNAKRKIRVAKGSGTTVQDVNRLLKMHKEMEGAMKKIRKMGGLKGLAAMFGGGGQGGMTGGGDAATMPSDADLAKLMGGKGGKGGMPGLPGLPGGGFGGFKKK